MDDLIYCFGFGKAGVFYLQAKSEADAKAKLKTIKEEGQFLGELISTPQGVMPELAAKKPEIPLEDNWWVG